MNSSTVKGVHFGLRRTSLAQRIDLTRRVRELLNRNEFLKAGNEEESIEAQLADLLAERLYLEWGLVELKGLIIDGETATVEALIERGPEKLAREISKAIQSEIELSDEELKNC